MRTISRDLQQRLERGATTICRCWKLQRRDGTVMGFTDHDEEITFGGIAFRAASGLDASALQSGTGLSVDNTQAVGALSDDAISEADIRAGRYDCAEVEHWLVDWQRPELKVQIFRGTIGEVERSDAGFKAELRGLAEDLNLPVGRTILRTCDRVLGDARCGVNLSVPEYSAEASARDGSTSGRIFTKSLERYQDSWFSQGTLRWLEGANQGLTFRIRRDAAEAGTRIIDLWELPPGPIVAGDRFLVSAGCDKHADTCRGKFSNFLNFRGFPHIPGEDWVVAYPKEGGVHDGERRGG